MILLKITYKLNTSSKNIWRRVVRWVWINISPSNIFTKYAFVRGTAKIVGCLLALQLAYKHASCGYIYQSSALEGLDSQGFSIQHGRRPGLEDYCYNIHIWHPSGGNMMEWIPREDGFPWGQTHMIKSSAGLLETWYSTRSQISPLKTVNNNSFFQGLHLQVSY